MREMRDFAAVWQRIREAGGRDFILTPGGSVSYESLARLVTRLCSAFDREGLGPGDRVVIVSRNDPVAGSAFIAAMLDGLVPVMLSADSGADRVDAICQSVEADLLIVDENAVDGLAVVRQGQIRRLTVPQTTRLEVPRQGLGAALRRIAGRPKQGGPSTGLGLPDSSREPRLPPVDGSSAYILFTSGTTTSPSGVRISKNALAAHLQTLTRLFDYGSGSRIFNATPLAHTDGLVQGLLLSAFNTATLLRAGPFTLTRLEEWLDSLSRFDATHFITNPTVLGLIDRFAAHDDYFDHDGFFGVLSSASILRPELWERFEKRFNCRLFNMYGMTETVANATYAGRHPEMGAFGTIGIAVDCEARLTPVDPEEASGVEATEGELQLRGENVFQGYWNNPERTAETLLEDGWMRTGDLARQRKDGSLEIIGRIKTMINMGGQSIMPEEIDEVLSAHPNVLDVATVGLSDPEFEEIAVTAVVLESAVTETDLAAFCRERLEQLKVPKRILAVDGIPRGGAGKPITPELRRLLTALVEEEAHVHEGQETNGISPASVYEMAAEVFRVPADELNSASSPATVEGWDSFNQLSLMIEAETRFGIRIPASQVASIRTLGDLYQAIIAKH